MEMNFIFDIQVRSPVTDLSSASVFHDFQHREVIVVMDGDSLLMFVAKGAVRRRSNVMVWSVCYRCARFGDGVLQSELFDILWGGI